MAVKPIPDRYHSITPYLVTNGSAAVIEFLMRAFDAIEIERHLRPDGAVRHAEVRIGDSAVMLGDASGRWKASPATLYLFVPDVDATYKRALDAGGAAVAPVETQFYGDRHGAVADPAGNTWWIATHVEDVSPEELARRSEAFARKQATP